jgi:hypothetical protein
MARPLRPVQVDIGSGLPVDYPWATSADVNRAGELRIYDGIRIRAFHPEGMWQSYTVRAAGPERHDGPAPSGPALDPPPPPPAGWGR